MKCLRQMFVSSIRFITPFHQMLCWHLFMLAKNNPISSQFFQFLLTSLGLSWRYSIVPNYWLNLFVFHFVKGSLLFNRFHKTFNNVHTRMTCLQISKHINWIDLGQDMFADLKIYDSHETKVKSSSFIQLD